MRTLLVLATSLLALTAPASASAFGLGGASCGPLEVPLLLDFPLFKAVGCPVAYVGAAAGTIAAVPVVAIVAPLPVAGSGSVADRFRHGTRVGRSVGATVLTLPVTLALGAILDMAFSP